MYYFYKTFSFIIIALIYTTCAIAGVGKGDNRFFFADEFLFEEYVPMTGDGSIECIYDAIDFFPLSAPYYTYFRTSDIHLVENIYANNISAIFFSKRMTDEAFLLPSDGDSPPVLFLDSLIKKMCPAVKTQANYKYKATGYYEDYLLVKTTDNSKPLTNNSRKNLYKNKVFSK